MGEYKKIRLEINGRRTTTMQKKLVLFTSKISTDN